MAEDPDYWFPAKRYGWGWGLPRTWQGWIVMAVFLALVALGVFLFPPADDKASFILYTVFLVVLLTAVCYLKGEPPRWRWGGK